MTKESDSQAPSPPSRILQSATKDKTNANPQPQPRRRIWRLVALLSFATLLVAYYFIFERPLQQYHEARKAVHNVNGRAWHTGDHNRWTLPWAPKFIDLKHRNLRSNTLESLKNIRNLEGLDLKGTGTSNDSVIHLKGHRNLKILSLIETQVHDDGLAHLSGLKKLEVLRLDMTETTGYGIREITHFNQLRELSLAHTQIRDDAFGHISKLINLKVLLAHDTSITNKALQLIQTMPSLQELDVANTEIGDAGLEFVKNQRSLEILDLEGTQITDKGLSHLQGLMNLRTVVLKRTEVTRTGVYELGKSLHPECVLEVDSFIGRQQKRFRTRVPDKQEITLHEEYMVEMSKLARATSQILKNVTNKTTAEASLKELGRPYLRMLELREKLMQFFQEVGPVGDKMANSAQGEIWRRELEGYQKQLERIQEIPDAFEVLDNGINKLLIEREHATDDPN